MTTSQALTALESFYAFLRTDPERYPSLLSELSLLSYLAELPAPGLASESTLRVRQVGSKLSLQHDGLQARGSVILPNLSYRLQAALIEWLHTPEERRALHNAITPEPHSTH